MLSCSNWVTPINDAAAAALLEKRGTTRSRPRRMIRQRQGRIAFLVRQQGAGILRRTSHRKLAITLRHPKLRVLLGSSHCARVIHVLQRPQSLAALTIRLATKKFTRPRRAGCRAVSILQLPYDLVGTIEEHLHHRADRSIF